MAMQISFISANYIARVLNYNGEHNWAIHDKATQQVASISHLDQVMTDVRAAGFDAMDLWIGHCHWINHAASDLPSQVPALARKHGLDLPSYAGGMNMKSRDDAFALFSAIKRMGIPLFAGGIGGLPDDQIPPIVQDVCQQLDVRWAFENHPQKSVPEILARIGHGRYNRCGVALDTGWCGTHSLNALDAVKALREQLFIVHLKDITAAGAHNTCALGEGIVPIEQVVRYLKDTQYTGTLCIEHEPFDRDPMPEIERSLQRVRHWLA